MLGNAKNFGREGFMMTMMMCSVVMIIMRVEFKHQFDPIRQACDDEGRTVLSADS